MIFLCFLKTFLGIWHLATDQNLERGSSAPLLQQFMSRSGIPPQQLQARDVKTGAFLASLKSHYLQPTLRKCYLELHESSVCCILKWAWKNIFAGFPVITFQNLLSVLLNCVVLKPGFEVKTVSVRPPIIPDNHVNQPVKVCFMLLSDWMSQAATGPLSQMFVSHTKAGLDLRLRLRQSNTVVKKKYLPNAL